MHQVVLKRLEALQGTGLDVSPEYPKVVRHAGLFLVEFGVCLEGETRSFPVPLKIGLSGFGEITWIETETLKNELSPAVLSRLKDLSGLAKPPIQLAYDARAKKLRLGLMEEVARRERSVGGILIYDAQGHITSIVVSLH